MAVCVFSDSLLHLVAHWAQTAAHSGGCRPFSDQYQPQDLWGQVCVLSCYRATSRRGHFSLCSSPLAHFLYFGIIGSLLSSSLRSGPAELRHYLCQSLFPAKAPPQLTSAPCTRAPPLIPAEGWCGQGLCRNSAIVAFPVPHPLCTDQRFLQCSNTPPKWKIWKCMDLGDG